jgi:hypothetical protein
MAAFPRTLPPATVTYPQNIGSLISVGQSGGLQTRSQNAQGLVWEETWPVLKAGNEDVQELLVTIQNLYNTGATCTLTHYLLPGSGKARMGTGNGTPVVDGASQSGTTLVTDGWDASEGVLKAGDCFTIAGLSVLFRATADVTSASSSSADTSISITPPIVAGSSPADNAAITTTGCTITAVILDYDAASAGPDEFIAGMKVTFQEAP